MQTYLEGDADDRVRQITEKMTLNFLCIIALDSKKLQRFDLK